MSSRSPTWSDRAATALAAVVLTPAAPLAPLPVDAELSAAGRTTLVVDLSAAPATGRRTVVVNVDGVPERAEIVPVVSDGLAVSLVVDASAAGAASLPDWLSAGARFSLAAPPLSRTVVIADRAPAALVTGPLRGPAGVVRALGTIRAAGDRDTEAALTLALRQFPGTGTGRRVVLLYTTAERVTGLPADGLAARLRAAGVLLVVVGTADPDRYWSSAAAATGGFFAPAAIPAVGSALDQVETTLSNRYLVRFGTPARLPARASVSVRTGDVTLSGETALGEPAPAAAPRPGILWFLIAAGSAGILTVAALVSLLHRRRSRPRPPASPYAVPLGPPPAPRRWGGMRPPPRGRAAVNGSEPPDTSRP